MNKRYLVSIFLAAFAQSMAAQVSHDSGGWQSEPNEWEELAVEDRESDPYNHYSAMSDENVKSQRMAEKKQMQPLEGIPKSARPMDKNGYGLWFTGEALLWQAVEDNLYYAAKDRQPPYPLNNTGSPENDPLRFDFEWNWGFRLGMGYNIPRDHWDLFLDWTHIENHAHGKNTAKGVFAPDEVWRTPIFATATVPGAATSIQGRWNVHLDQIDLQLGREFYAGRRLTFRPSVGLRSAFILQKEHIFAQGPGGQPFAAGPVSSRVKLQNQFWGFGFAAGIDTDWQLGCGFSLFGKASFALLLGYFKIHERGSVIQPSNSGANGGVGWRLRSSSRTEKPIFDLAMGFKWSRTFCDERYGLTLKAGYEYHCYENQNQYLQDVGIENATQRIVVPVATPGDLAYQGLTLSGQIDF